MRLMKDTIFINVVDCKIVRIKTKKFNQIWITDLKANEVSFEALKEDEIIKYSNLIPLSSFPLHHPRVSIWLERPWKSKVEDLGFLELHFWSQ